MYAVVTHVIIEPEREDEMKEGLLEMVVPASKQRPGFQAGYWLRSRDGRRGLAMELFDSEEAAGAVTENPPQPPEDAPVKLDRMEVYEVQATA